MFKSAIIFAIFCVLLFSTMLFAGASFSNDPNAELFSTIARFTGASLLFVIILMVRDKERRQLNH